MSRDLHIKNTYKKRPASEQIVYTAREVPNYEEYVSPVRVEASLLQSHC